MWLIFSDKVSHSSHSYFVPNNLVQIAGTEVSRILTLVETKIHYDCSTCMLYVEETSSTPKFLRTVCLYWHSFGFVRLLFIYCYLEAFKELKVQLFFLFFFFLILSTGFLLTCFKLIFWHLKQVNVCCNSNKTKGAPDSSIHIKVIYPHWYIPLIPNLNTSEINLKRIDKRREEW